MQQPMHSLLKRQLKRYLGRADAVPSEWRPLIEAVSDAYHEFDTDRGMLERSLDLSSVESTRANADLRESTERFRQIVESAGEWVWEVDATGLYTYASPVVETMLGFKPEEIVGKKHFYDFFAPDVREQLKKAGLEAFARKEPFQAFVNPNIHKDGRVIVLETRGAPILDQEGRLLGYRGTDMDITERKRAEIEVRKLLVESDNARVALLGILEDAKRAGNALQENTVFLNTLLDAMPVPVYYKNTEGLYIGVNKAFEAFFGKPNSELIGKTAYDIAAPEWADIYRAKDIELFQHPGAQVYDGKLTDAQGRMRDVIFHKAAFTDTRGKVAGLVGAILDITERNRNEEELKFRNILLSTQQEVSIDGILVVDENARIVSYNRRFIEMWSLPPELVEKGLDEPVLRFVTDQLLNPRQFFDRVQYLYEHREETSREEIALGDGRTFDRYSAPMSGSDDRYYGRIWYFRDITDRKQAEEELRRNYDIQNVTECLLRLSLDDLPLEANLQRALELVVAIPWLSLESKGAIFLTGDEPGVLRMVAQKALGDAVRASCEEVPFGRCLCGRAASTRTIQFSDHINEDHEVQYPGMAPHGHYCVPILWGDRVLGVMALYLREGHVRNEREMDFLRSVGDAIAGVVQLKSAEQEIRKLNEELEGKVRDRTAQLEAANKELEAFSYSVSHDLRAPLRGIDGFSQHVLEECKDRLTEEGVQDLGRVRAAAQKMSKLIDDMLSLSRLTRQEMRIAPVDLSRLVEQIVSELRQAEPARKMDFVVAPGVMADGDERLLRQVMQNLLSNAWKFTRQQQNARIEFGTMEQDGKRVLFVRDNGAGFDMAYAKKLFGAFQRLHSEREFEGTGIGLAIVQRIIRRHGGKVWAESKMGKGTTFYFTI